jgi:predicted MarR family transcription regulator
MWAFKPLRELCRVLNEEDKQWINERLEKLETTLLIEFCNCAVPVELRQDIEEARDPSN